METSKYVGSYPPVGGHSLNQNQTASSTPTNLNGIQPQQNGAVYARAPRHGSAEGDQLLPERNPYRPYLPNNVAQRQTRHHQQPFNPFLERSAFDMNTPSEPRRANQWPSPRADETLSSATQNGTQGRRLQRRPKLAKSQQTLVDKGVSPALENQLWAGEPPIVAETPSHRPRQATLSLQHEAPSQRDPGHDNHTSGHRYDPSTGRFEPDRSLGSDATSPVIRYYKTLKSQNTGEVPGESSNQQSLYPQQRPRASTGVVQYDNRQNPLHPQLEKPSNMIASGGNRSLHQSEDRRPSGSNALRNTNAAQPQQVSVGQTPLNDIQQVRDQYKMYAQQFYTLTQPQKDEMKILRGIIDAHEKSGSGRPQKNGRGRTKDSRRQVQHRQRQPQTLARPAAKRNVGHVDISSDAEDQNTARPQAKKVRQDLHGNEDMAMYEEMPGPTAASQRDGAMKSTKVVGPRKSVQRWVDEQTEQTNAMPNQYHEMQPQEVDPADQRSDSNYVPDVRPLRVQHHRDGTRTEHFHLRPLETLIPKPFGRLAHFVPPDTILMVVSPDDDCGYVCPSGSTEVETRTYMSLAAAQLGMITAYQVKSLQEAMVPLEHIKVAVYDDRTGFQEPTAGINDEGRVASLTNQMERAVRSPNDDGGGSRGPAASNIGEVRGASPPRNVPQPVNTPKLGNGMPMTPANQTNSNAGTSQKSAPIQATSLSLDGSKQQESSPAAVNSQVDQPAHERHSHSQPPEVIEAEISVNEIGMPQQQTYASISSLDPDTQSHTNKDQSSSDRQEFSGSLSLPLAHPASDPTFLDGAFDIDSINYGQTGDMPQSEAEHSLLSHSQSGCFGDMLSEDWLNCPMPAAEVLDQNPGIGISTLEQNMQPTDVVPHASSGMSVWDRPLLQESDDILMGLDFNMDRDMAY